MASGVQFAIFTLTSLFLFFFILIKKLYSAVVRDSGAPVNPILHPSYRTLVKEGSYLFVVDFAFCLFVCQSFSVDQP